MPSLNTAFSISIAVAISLCSQSHASETTGTLQTNPFINPYISEMEATKKPAAKSTPQLELTAPIGMDIVCFRFNPGGMETEALNELNQSILVCLQEGGIAAPSYTTLNGEYCLRVAIANHRSKLEDFDLMVDAVIKLGMDLM